MIKIKRKLFSKQGNKESSSVNSSVNPPNQLTSRDMQLEQMKLQRQLMQTNRMRQRLEAEERRDESRRIMQLQKMEQRKDIEEDKQRVRIRKMEEGDQNNNTSLYKSKSHPVAPVSMK